MLDVQIDGTVALIKILPGGDIAADQAALQSIPDADRRWDGATRRWVVARPDSYRHIPAIRQALQSRARQIPMFE